MEKLFTLILALGIITGQIIRIPFGGGAVILLDIVALIFCLSAILKIKLKLFNPPSFLKIAFLFILVCIFSLILTPLSLNQNELIISFSYIVRLASYFLLCYLFFSRVFEKIKTSLTSIFLLSGVLLSGLGLLQFIFLPNLQQLTSLGWDPHYFRTVSTFLDPNFAGAFFALTLILLFQNFKKNKLNIFLFLIVYLALLTTFSRSSYLMFLVSGVTLALLKKSRKLLFIVIFLFLILLSAFQIYTQIVAQPKNISREQSASFRLNTWVQGLTIFQKSPILGVGFNAYRFAIKEFNLGDEQFIQSHGSSSNDSSILYVAATTGLLGLVVYLFFIFNMFKYSYPQNLILISALAGLLVHSIFANSLFYPPILLWILLMISIPKK